MLFLLAAAVSLRAQVEPPIGILKGEVVSVTASVFEMRGSDKVLYQCGYDFRTYFEKENQRIVGATLRSGETVEVVTDHQPGSNSCYARTVHVIDPTVRSSRWRPNPRPTESFAPRGELEYAGLVVRQDNLLLVVKTRKGDVTLRKRSDTRYLAEGQKAGAAGVSINTRVFLRAGRNLDGELEVYQVIWGTMMKD
jgi:hypothetical protein